MFFVVFDQMQHPLVFLNFIRQAPLSHNQCSHDSVEACAIVPVQPDHVQPEAVIVVINESNHVISEPYTSATNLNKSFNELIPLPKSVRNCHSKRAVAHAKAITASPYKRKLEEALQKRTGKWMQRRNDLKNELRKL